MAALGAATVLVYIYLALFTPGTLTYSPFTIQDDLRQFGSWLPRLRDPTLLAGDPIAAYWRAVSPPLYRLPFIAAARVGLDPLLFARVLPIPLLALSLWAAWRLALMLCQDRQVAFYAAAFCFGYMTHEDSLFSATPRAFSHPLLLLALHAIVSRQRWLTVALLVPLASIYPTTAVVVLGIFALSQLRWGPVRRVLQPGAVWPLAAAAFVVVAAALPLAIDSKPWGPVVTLEQAMETPSMNRPDGRNSIVGAGGRIAWVCSARVGFLPQVLPCGWKIPGLIPVTALLLVPLVLLGLRAAGKAPDGTQPAPANLIYLQALIASILCFAAAWAIAFKLHFPGRYSERILGPLEWLAIGQMLGTWLANKRGAWKGAIIAVLALLAVTPLPGFVRPTDPGLLRLIRTFPPSTRIGGLSEDLALLPALTGRAITAAPELAIAGHAGYYGPIEQNLRRSLVVMSNQDLRTALPSVDGDYLLVDVEFLRHSVIPERYGQIVPSAVASARMVLALGPSAAQRYAQRCAVHRGLSTWLLDTRCLIWRAQSPPL